MSLRDYRKPTESEHKNEPWKAEWLNEKLFSMLKMLNVI